MSTSSPLLEVCEVSKRFPGVQALDRVSLRLNPGEVLAVVGENGAGKSTLMKILAGIYPPDSGTILLDGRPMHLGSVKEALERGISLIHQELNLADNLSITANLFLGREIRTGWLGLLDNRRMTEQAQPLMRRVGLTGSPHTLVGHLSPGQRQLVEVARALSQSVRILIMDEPTSSLSQRETDTLYQVIRDLKNSGVAILYISHRLAEVQEVADRVTVLRDGRNAGDLDRTGGRISHDAMVRLMVGRDTSQLFHKDRHRASERVRLELRELRFLGIPGNPAIASGPISLQVYAGEILGIAGLVGAGRTELAEALFGLRPVVSGQMLLDGQPIHLRSPHDAVEAGLALVPEDRRLHGLMLDASVLHNLSLPNLDRLSRLHLVVQQREQELGKRVCNRLHVRTPSLRQRVGLLSGGNQQKVVVGKWLVRQPRVLIFDEPTRGVDIGAKSAIYALLDELAGGGAAILMISSDLEEILGMSDRVAVLHCGRLTGVLERSRLSEEAVMQLATGGTAAA